MAITALILDDEAQSRKALQGKLNLFCPEVSPIYEASTVDEAWELLLGHKPQMLFLDIHLAGELGFDLLEKLSTDEPEWNGAVVFVTAHDAYALRAIKFSALDYLLKPVDPEELVKAVRKVEQDSPSAPRLGVLVGHLKERDRKLVIASSEGMHVVRIQDILRCESTSNYTQFFLRGGKKLLASRTLKEYEGLLTPHHFERIHKSHLVNMDCVKRYVTAEGGYVILEDDSHVPVANRKKEVLVARLRAL
ncbi:MAG: LytTR family DNA-binding domain-containing protein [Cryomorphaceae bacterium]|jgi:two-component system, LytTR family, response regulator|tara:strand:+ start:742 stop:1488 length:747 start_codon:yes stop_codon:yes gene_type:complete